MLLSSPISCVYNSTHKSEFFSYHHKTSLLRKGKLPKEIHVADSLVKLVQAHRSNTPVREGPGTGFAIKPTLIQRGQIFLELGRYKNWLKITTPNKKFFGWLKQNQVFEVLPKGHWLTILTKNLPIQQTTKKNVLYQIDSQKKHSSLPKLRKGDIIYVLKDLGTKIVGIHAKISKPIKISKRDIR